MSIMYNPMYKHIINMCIYIIYNLMYKHITNMRIEANASNDSMHVNKLSWNNLVTHFRPRG